MRWEVSGSSSKPPPRSNPIDRNQQLLQPLDVDRLIDGEHPARKIWRAVEGVAGRRAHSPELLVSVWLYAYSKGLHSAREIERKMHHEPGREWLTDRSVTITDG